MLIVAQVDAEPYATQQVDVEKLAREAAENIVPECLSRTCFIKGCGYDQCWGCDDQKTERARIAFIIASVFASSAGQVEDAEIRRLQDGVRNHLIALGAPDCLIDGAGCDSDDPLDFTKTEITQAFNYFEEVRSTGQVEDVLADLREMFPEVTTYKRVSNTGEHSGTSGESWTQSTVVVGGNVFLGATLTEAMSKVREWKEQQK